MSDPDVKTKSADSFLGFFELAPAPPFSRFLKNEDLENASLLKRI